MANEGASRRHRAQSFSSGITLGIGATAVVAAALAVEACSSDKPLVAAEDGHGPDGGQAAVTDAASLDGAEAGPGVRDASEPDVEAGICLDETPSSVDGGGAVCPMAGPCSEPCLHIASNYKAGVAHAAVECIASLASCEVAADTIPCVDQALARACADPSAAGYCGPLVVACDPNAGDAGSSISQGGCEMFANGLSTAGRAAFKACMDDKIAQGSCAADVGECADLIRQ